MFVAYSKHGTLLGICPHPEEAAMLIAGSGGGVIKYRISASDIEVTVLTDPNGKVCGESYDRAAIACYCNMPE